jgi:hypothetical protein
MSRCRWASRERCASTWRWRARSAVARARLLDDDEEVEPRLLALPRVDPRDEDAFEPPEDRLEPDFALPRDEPRDDDAFEPPEDRLEPDFALPRDEPRDDDAFEPPEDRLEPDFALPRDEPRDDDAFEPPEDRLEPDALPRLADDPPLRADPPLDEPPLRAEPPLDEPPLEEPPPLPPAFATCGAPDEAAAVLTGIASCSSTATLAGCCDVGAVCGFDADGATDVAAAAESVARLAVATDSHVAMRMRCFL